MDTLVSGDPSALFWLARRRARSDRESIGSYGTGCGRWSRPGQGSSCARAGGRAAGSGANPCECHDSAPKPNSAENSAGGPAHIRVDIRTHAHSEVHQRKVLDWEASLARDSSPRRVVDREPKQARPVREYWRRGALRVGIVDNRRCSQQRQRQKSRQQSQPKPTVAALTRESYVVDGDVISIHVLAFRDENTAAVVRVYAAGWAAAGRVPSCPGEVGADEDDGRECAVGGEARQVFAGRDGAVPSLRAPVAAHAICGTGSVSFWERAGKRAGLTDGWNGRWIGIGSLM